NSMTNCRTQTKQTEPVASAEVDEGSGRLPSVRTILQVWIPAVLLTGVFVSVTGCRSFRPSDGEGIFANSDLLSTKGIRGPLERTLSGQDDVLSRGARFSEAGQRQAVAARKLFDEQKYPEALKRYKAIAKKYPESSAGEEAWFRIGECHFAMQELPAAQDAYDKLFVDYPSTKYVADASRRLFTIAKTWLEITDPLGQSQIKTVSQENEIEGPKPESSSSDPSAKYGLIPNFFDKTRPIFDTKGRARNALKSIWLNDPTGPLADDALMLTASYYMRRDNYIEADRYFEILREEYPDSPHLEDAFVLGSHVKQMSYRGPFYDGTSLISASNLKERTLQLFPDSEDRQQIRKDLQRLHLLEAQRAWSRVDFYRRKDNPRAVAIQCMQVITEFPETRYAEMARTEIRRINPAAVRGLPGVAEFMQSLPSASESATETPESSPSESRVKSVSASGNRSPVSRL
ncbi:MAG TPA: outer membrane protein assembly factor BamD, partial [Fuerstia sp.]|nr:outer membrane protein assembly factor BamD [Fuerstiella sp.]